MSNNNLGLTEEQVASLLWEEDAFDDDDNVIYQFIERNVVDTDQEKGRVEYRVIIKSISNGKFYSAILAGSPWHMQSEVNAEATWKEVKPSKKTITVYQ